MVRRFDERGRETDPIGPDRFEVGLGLSTSRFGGGRVRVEFVEPQLLLAEVDGRLGGTGRRGGLRRSGHDANDQRRGEEKARQPVWQQPRSGGMAFGHNGVSRSGGHLRISVDRDVVVNKASREIKGTTSKMAHDPHGRA